MRLPSVELDDHTESPVPDVTVEVPAARRAVADVPEADRQSVPALDVPAVRQLQWRCDAVLSLGQQLSYEPAPPMASPAVQRDQQSRGGRGPALDGGQDEVCGSSGAFGLTDIEHSSFYPDSRRCGRGVEDGCRRSLHRPAQMYPHSRLPVHASRRRQADVNRRRAFVEYISQPQRRAVTGRRARPRVQHRRPHRRPAGDRTGECCIDPGVQALPASVVDITPRLSGRQTDAQQLSTAEDAVLGVGELAPGLGSGGHRRIVAD